MSLSVGTGGPTLAASRAQRGITLLVVLILLLILSVLGIAILRSSAMQERMSANMRDRSLAFQSAEAALRMGESVAQGKPTVPTTPGSCAVGLCGKPNPTAAPRMLTCAGSRFDS